MKQNAILIQGSKDYYLWALFLGAVMVLLPDIALALPQGATTLNGVVTQVNKEIQGGGISVTLNAVGLAAIGYSAFNGLSKGPLIAGGLILFFTNTYFPFVNSNFAVG
jgi:hypothetical protein